MREFLNFAFFSMFIIGGVFFCAIIGCKLADLRIDRGITLKVIIIKKFGKKVNNVCFYENRRDVEEDSKEEVGYVLKVFGKNYFFRCKDVKFKK